MNSLAEHQRKLLGMIKGTYSPASQDEPYLHQVAGSSQLALVREIATWWRIFDIERYCVLTSRYLKMRGIYEDTVDTFVRNHAISPFINELGEAFLVDMGQSEDSALSALARFELRLVQVKRGDAGEYQIEWDLDPVAVLNHVIKGDPMDLEQAQGRYHTVVSASLPGLFAVLPGE
jgi:hypothetical protein